MADAPDLQEKRSHGPPLPAAKESFSSRTMEAIKARPEVSALAIITVVVLLLLFFFYAQKRSWFGLGAQKRRRAASEGGPKKARTAPDDEEDPETKTLIDSINGFGR
ncbi:hypothetical protein ElyMa_002511100 [Elysia marginata]|uniref:Uncharacterized protein n=1 Tax=Elysia marginata TaxID=1093978 RepID=A0AAV4GR06_9GAST|nr:hypothetical protein ElyMa_002511100 [Elysia marginata]